MYKLHASLERLTGVEGRVAGGVAMGPFPAGKEVTEAVEIRAARCGNANEARQGHAKALQNVSGPDKPPMPVQLETMMTACTDLLTRTTAALKTHNEWSTCHECVNKFVTQRKNCTTALSEHLGGSFR